MQVGLLRWVLGVLLVLGVGSVVQGRAQIHGDVGQAVTVVLRTPDGIDLGDVAGVVHLAEVEAFQTDGAGRFEVVVDPARALLVSVEGFELGHVSAAQFRASDLDEELCVELLPQRSIVRVDLGARALGAWDWCELRDTESKAAPSEVEVLFPDLADRRYVHLSVLPRRARELCIFQRGRALLWSQPALQRRSLQTVHFIDAGRTRVTVLGLPEVPEAVLDVGIERTVAEQALEAALLPEVLGFHGGLVFETLAEEPLDLKLWLGGWQIHPSLFGETQCELRLTGRGEPDREVTWTTFKRWIAVDLEPPDVDVRYLATHKQALGEGSSVDVEAPLDPQDFKTGFNVGGRLGANWVVSSPGFLYEGPPLLSEHAVRTGAPLFVAPFHGQRFILPRPRYVGDSTGRYSVDTIADEGREPVRVACSDLSLTFVHANLLPVFVPSGAAPGYGYPALSSAYLDVRIELARWRYDVHGLPPGTYDVFWAWGGAIRDVVAREVVLGPDGGEEVTDTRRFPRILSGRVPADGLDELPMELALEGQRVELDANGRFLLRARVPRNGPYELTGTVHFPSGATRDVQFNLEEASLRTSDPDVTWL